jgi:hypothetical protein
MDWMRIAQGLVFFFAAFLVVVVGMRGIDPDGIPLGIIYTALYAEALMLVVLAMLYIFLKDNGGNNRTLVLRTTLMQVDENLQSVVQKLNQQSVAGTLPANVLDELSEIKGKIGYMKGIVN